MQTICKRISAALLCSAAFISALLLARTVWCNEMDPATENASTDASYFPPEERYPQNTADPHRLRFSMRYLRMVSSDIAGSGDDRVDLSAGGRFGLVRMLRTNMQLSIEGGFDAQFDMDHQLDNIGWDGNYGLLLTRQQASGVAWKLAALHTSSHVGDEYAERTGRMRIGYTRHEIAIGVSVPVGEVWRIYAEGARGYDPGNSEMQRPWRAEIGLEYEQSGRERPSGWYGACDLGSWQERDWRVDLAVQAGYRIRSGVRTWRFGIEHVRGRPPLGEFFQNTDRYLGVGAWLDV